MSENLMITSSKLGGERHQHRDSEELATKHTEPLESDAPAPAIEVALAGAYARAEASKIEILGRADMLTGEQLAQRLGLVRATVNNRRVAGKLFALDFGTKRGVRYPAWQCDLIGETAGRESFESVMRALATVSAWSRYRFFTRASPALGGRTPIEALKRGDGIESVKAAETWASGEQGGA
jgi:hypothetical protein